MSNKIDILLDEIKDTGMSIYELSKELDIPKSRFYAWTQGRAAPKHDDVQKLVLWLKTKKEGKGPKNTENPLPETPTILSTDSENPKREKMESDLNKLISSNQLLAEANKDLAAGHKLLVEMLYRSTGGAVAKNVEDLNALVIGLQSVLLEVATGKRFANDFEVIKAMHKADGKTPKVEKKGIRDLVDNQDTAL